MTTTVLTSASNSFVDSFGLSQIPIIGDLVEGQVKEGLNAGATSLGNSIDSELFGIDEKNIVRGRKLTDFAIQRSSYGEAIPIIYGKARIAGNIIWSTKVRVLEDKSPIGQGGKGSGAKVEKKTETKFRYFVNLAIALCEGEIDSVDRIWADSDLINPADYATSYNVYTGSEEQFADPVIQSFEGMDIPAYRGISYVVFEDFEITEFRGRIPNFTFEVNRNLKISHDDNKLESLIKGVNIIPGCGEFVYDTLTHTKTDGVEILGIWHQTGAASALNQNNSSGKADALVALDNLQKNFPNIEYMSLVCCWFGDSLDANICTIKPRVEYQSQTKTFPSEWGVAGLSRATATLITQIDGSPLYGGTPSDESVLRYIEEIKNRGLKVKFYPVVFMDMIDKPWRGRITCEASEVENFFTKTNGYNDFILHYANLVKDKVDAFIIGSEMKGLTSIQDLDNSFPAVDALVSLAAEVKTIMGSSTKLSYAADWSEYHSVSGWYNLDLLWASDDIDFIGIDAYFPLTDRIQNGRYDTTEIIGGWENGEGYEWYYTDEARTIKAYLSPEYAWKNISWWWNNNHINPDSSTTDFVPQSKKIWFTEFGFPSVDGCANQPNVFYNPDSVEGGLPNHSKGYIDFLAQRTALLGTLLKWQDSDMVEEKFIWAYDARPYPFYPDLTNIWSDGNIWSRGHWINGKLGIAELKNIISDLCKKAGIPEEKIDISKIDKLVSGYNLSGTYSAIEALRALQAGYFFDLSDGEKIKFIERSFTTETFEIDFEELIFDDKAKQRFDLLLEKTSSENVTSELSLNYISENNNYLVGSYNLSRSDNDNSKKVEINLPILLNRSYAEKIAESLLLEEELTAQKAVFSLPYKYIYLEAGDIIKIIKDEKSYQFKILSSKTDNGKIKINALRFEDNFYNNAISELSTEYNSSGFEPLSDTKIEILDIPHLPNEVNIDKAYLYLAACGVGNNWDGAAIYISNLSETEGFEKVAEITSAATQGVIENALSESTSLLIDKTSGVEVNLVSGSLESVSEDSLQQFRNIAVIGNEILQYKNAVQTGQGRYILSYLYRGRQGTESHTGHTEGSRFILLDDNILKIEIPVSQIGQKLWIKAVTFGKNIEDASANEITFYGNSLKPYSPVHISAEREGDDINIEWFRRSRSNISFSSLVELPLFETKEEYEIDIFDGLTLKRTEKIDEDNFNYTEAMQTSDFGGPANDFTVKIYQMSNKIGRGEAGISEVSI